MSEDDQGGGYGDKKRIQAWLDGWGQYFWGALAVVLAGFILWNIVAGLR